MRRTRNPVYGYAVPSVRIRPSPPIMVAGLSADKTPTANAEAIIVAVGSDEINPTEFVTAMASVVKVLEVDDLTRRLEAIERRRQS